MHGLFYLWGWVWTCFYQIFFPAEAKQKGKSSCSVCPWVHKWWGTANSVLMAPLTQGLQSAFTSPNELGFTAAWHLHFTGELRGRWSNVPTPCSSTKSAPAYYAIDQLAFAQHPVPEHASQGRQHTSQSLLPQTLLCRHFPGPAVQNAKSTVA